MIESCSSCGFELWLPIASLSVADLGFYSDSRFPGRCILKLRDHYESLEDLPEDLTASFMADLKAAMGSIRFATGAERVNFAVLGNAVPHVHGHLIPRLPELEELPNSSPWDDPRVKAKLSTSEASSLIALIREGLNSYGERK